MSPGTAPPVLAFPDRKENGAFPVRRPDGRTVAAIATRWTGSGFTATDTCGGLLCAGSAAWGGLSGTWTATGPGHAPLLEVKRGWTGRQAEVRMARGGRYRLRGSVWRRDFAVQRTGATIVSAVPQSSALSFAPYAYAVRQHEPVFDLAELVAIVQIWRTLKRHGAAAAGGAAGAIGAAGAAGG